jgi:regulatory protein
MGKKPDDSKGQKGAFAPTVEFLRRYCAFQERSSSDVRLKAKKTGLSSSEADEAVQILSKEGFLDDKRYVNAFINGKLHYNKWGKIKIKAELKARKLNNELIDEALQGIDKETYLMVLRSVVEKKMIILQKDADSDIHKKLTRYALSKGFEYDLVFPVVKDILRT